MKQIRLGTALIVIAFLLSLSSCAGGGSQGTGGLRYQGTLYADSSTLKLRDFMPLSGITVTIGATGDSAISDEHGFYSIETDWVASEVEILFDAAGFSAKYTLSGVPENARRVTLDFSVDRAANRVALLSAGIETAGNSSSGTSDAGPNASSASNDNQGGDGGTSNSTISNNSSSSMMSQSKGQKVTICHKPDSGNPTTLNVSPDAVDGHLAHGDTLGPCPE